MNRTTPRIALTIGLMAAAAWPAQAQNWSPLATISTTIGVSDSRICVGEGTRGDVGCPSYAPSLTTAGDVSVTGNLSANAFIGDGSGLTGVTASSGDRIVSGTTSMLAVSNTGYVSLTQAGVNTGWFNPQLGLVTLGVSATGPISGSSGYFYGNLGIGTTNPSQHVAIVGSGGGNGTYLQVTNNASGQTATDGFLIGYGSDNNVELKGQDANAIKVFTNGVERMRIDNAGNVGIGTGTPAYKLDVNGVLSVAQNSAAIRLGTAAILGIGNGSGISTGTRLAGDSILFTPRNNGTVDMFMSNTGNIGIGTTAPTSVLQVSGTFTVSNSAQTTTPSLFVATSGNVGIGTSAPATELHLSSSGNTDIRLQRSDASSGATSSLFFGGTTTGTTWAPGSRIRAYAQDLMFETDPTFDATDALAERMRITAAGNVGVGTSTPSRTFHVAGTALTTSWTGINFSSSDNVTPTAPLEVSGTISATALVINGQSITGGTSDRIVSNSTGLTANSDHYISVTTNNVVTGYFDTTGRLVTPGISVTTNQLSATTAYFSGNVGIGMSSPAAALHVSSTTVRPALRLSYGVSYTDIYTTNIGRTNFYNLTDQWQFGGTSPAIKLMDASYATQYATWQGGAGGTLYYNYVGPFSLRNLASGMGFSIHTSNTVKFNIGSGTDGAFDFYNGTGNVLFRGTGNVGVGTTTPTSALQVSGTFTVSSTNTNANPALYVSTSGNVGIGTSAPSATLTVAPSNVASTAPTAFFQDQTPLAGLTSVIIRNGVSNTTAENYTKLFQLQDSAGTAFVYYDQINSRWSVPSLSLGNGGNGIYSPTKLFMRSDMKLSWSSSTNAAGSSDVGFSRMGAGVLEVNDGATSGNYRDLQLRALNPTSGNVGIGTTSPSAKLEVAGAISATGISTTGVITATTAMHTAQLCDENGSNCKSISSLTAGGDASARGDRISTTGVASGAGLAMVATDGDMISFTTSGVNTAYLDSFGRYVGPGVSITAANGISSTNGYFSGNVGIGTSVPSVPLEVSGTISATALSIRGTVNQGLGEPFISLTRPDGSTFRLTAGAASMLANSRLFLHNDDAFLAATNSNTATRWFTLYNENPTSNTLALRFNLEPQAFRIYNTRTNASNYERAMLSWKANSNVFQIGTEAAGTGTVRNIAFTGGNVGIGTIAPTAMLEVAGTISATGISTTGVITATTALHTAEICDENGANCADVSAGLGSGGGSAGATDRISTTGVASGAGLAMVATDGAMISFTTSGVNTAYLDSSGRYIGPGVSITTANGISSTNGYFAGNVGIGTSAPQNELHIHDPSATRVDLTMTHSSSGGTSSDGLNLFLSSTSGYLLNREGGALFLGSAGNLSQMMLAANGNVGIGTTAPAATLQVSGSFIVSTSTQNTTPSLFVGASGNVGIGTGAPASVLHVVKSLAGVMPTEVARFSNSSGSERGLSVMTTTASSGQWVGLQSYGTQQDFSIANAAGTRNLTIKDNGSVGIGTTEPAARLDVVGNIGLTGSIIGTSAANLTLRASGDTDNALLLESSTGRTNGAQIYLYGRTHSSAGRVLYYASSDLDDSTSAHAWYRTTSGGTNNALLVSRNNGDLVVYGSGTTCTIGSGTGNTSCTSDERLKKDIKPIEGALDKISLLRGVTFHWKDENKSKRENIGLIAQNVQKVFPQLVADDEGLLSVDYASLVAPMIEAMKELKAANDNLKRQNEALRDRLNELNSRMDRIERRR